MVTSCPSEEYLKYIFIRNDNFSYIKSLFAVICQLNGLNNLEIYIICCNVFLILSLKKHIYIFIQ